MPLCTILTKCPAPFGPQCRYPPRPCPARPGRASGGARRAGRERREERIETAHDVRFAADHQAVAALETPHAAARAAVDVVKTMGRQSLRPVHVVPIVRVAAVDDHVARRQDRDELCERVVHDGGGNHQPHDARCRELRDEIAERRAADRAVADERTNRVRGYVVHYAVEVVAQPAPYHVGAHAPQTDHAYLHRVLVAGFSLMTPPRARSTPRVGTELARFSRTSRCRPIDTVPKARQPRRSRAAERSVRGDFAERHDPCSDGVTEISKCERTGARP